MSQLWNFSNSEISSMNNSLFSTCGFSFVFALHVPQEGSLFLLVLLLYTLIYILSFFLLVLFALQELTPPKICF